MEPARCPWPDCQAAYPAPDRERRTRCAHCGRTVRIRLVRHLGTLEARRAQAGERAIPAFGPADVAVILDDIRSLWNVGSLFRSADGLGIRHLFLCGITGLPTEPEVHRTALGAEEVVSWSYHPHPFEAEGLFRRQGGTLVAVERCPGAQQLPERLPEGPLFLAFGNEPDGVCPELLERADRVVEIPMHGVKNSLNVAVTGGIAMHWFTRLRPA